ncbi:hypothetical protein [Gordonia hankookensis]|uniref:Uncharacterized protein n=1 Tax=Gordonia hankookensis TaxID=589403 RepID=A0ABR7WBK5_9ACTN|nr:hypothetical protein [Gordonia hankookensis]MBD1320194.1 hypothetical protein [Gordonia hankookensis]
MTQPAPTPILADAVAAELQMFTLVGEPFTMRIEQTEATYRSVGDGARLHR